jgi:hypothetical protein
MILLSWRALGGTRPPPPHGFLLPPEALRHTFPDSLNTGNVARGEGRMKNTLRNLGGVTMEQVIRDTSSTSLGSLHPGIGMMEKRNQGNMINLLSYI